MAILRVGEGDTPPDVRSPAILLINPKFSANVVNTHRLAACFGIPQVWCTGDRVAQDMGHRRKTRLPPEERMRGFGRVDLVWCDRALEVHRAAGARVVGVEFRGATASLLDLAHDDATVYVFGPEDGQLDESVAGACDTVVHIPAHHCLNLATAVAAVLWDRTSKLWRDHGVVPPGPPGTPAPPAPPGTPGPPGPPASPTTATPPARP